MMESVLSSVLADIVLSTVKCIAAAGARHEHVAGKRLREITLPPETYAVVFLLEAHPVTVFGAGRIIYKAVEPVAVFHTGDMYMNMHM